MTYSPDSSTQMQRHAVATHRSGAPWLPIEAPRHPSVTATVASSIGGTDNVQRVYYGSPGGKSLVLSIDGIDVDAPAFDGCNNNEIRVFYAYYYEDAARNDPEGPGTEIEADD